MDSADGRVRVVAMRRRDIEQLVAVWRKTERGLTLREADEPEAITRFLSRNPDLSFVARDRAGNA